MRIWTCSESRVFSPVPRHALKMRAGRRIEGIATCLFSLPSVEMSNHTFLLNAEEVACNWGDLPVVKRDKGMLPGENCL